MHSSRQRVIGERDGLHGGFRTCATIARERGIDAGLHLNFTTSFPAPARSLWSARKLASYFAAASQHSVSPWPDPLLQLCRQGPNRRVRRLYGRSPGGWTVIITCTSARTWSLRATAAPEPIASETSFQPGWRRSSGGIVSLDGPSTKGSGPAPPPRGFLFRCRRSTHPARLEGIFLPGSLIVVEVGDAPREPGRISVPDRRWDFRYSDRPSVRAAERKRTDFISLLPLSAAYAITEEHHDQSKRHTTVCVCTYKRLGTFSSGCWTSSLRDTGGLFTCYSIVVADNDRLRSAEAVVSEFAAASTISITYCMEAQQNISLTRNKAVENATGDFIAFIDDDEFPTRRWLLTLFNACNNYDVDGVLGPVRCHFDEEPPKWVVKGRFYERPTYPTGFVIDWTKGRTGNVLLKCVVRGSRSAL